jgi:hypothetical protein
VQRRLRLEVVALQRFADAELRALLLKRCSSATDDDGYSENMKLLLVWIS